tara:strand:+ start:56 stop:355 length:300 start_codon:yes stop_codon:yes gene_type:complete
MSDPLDDLLGTSDEPKVVIRTGGRLIENPDPLKTLFLKGISPDAKGRKQITRVAAVMGMSIQAFNSAFGRKRWSYHALKKLERNSDGRILWAELEQYCI